MDMLKFTLKQNEGFLDHLLISGYNSIIMLQMCDVPLGGAWLFLPGILI